VQSAVGEKKNTREPNWSEFTQGRSDSVGVCLKVTALRLAISNKVREDSLRNLLTAKLIFEAQLTEAYFAIADMKMLQDTRYGCWSILASRKRYSSSCRAVKICIAFYDLIIHACSFRTKIQPLDYMASIQNIRSKYEKYRVKGLGRFQRLIKFTWVEHSFYEGTLKIILI